MESVRQDIQQRYSSPFVLVVEGLIGSGKSSIIEHCLVPILTQRGWKVTVIKEPVCQWGEILPLFYADPQRWGYTFQTIAFHDRVREMINVWDKHVRDGLVNQPGHIFIAERSPLSDTIFVNTLYQQGQFSDMEYQYYYKWWNMWNQVVPFIPDLFIYLSPSMPEIMRRVRMRARPGEETIGEDYQQLLKKFHDELFLQEYVNIIPQVGNVAPTSTCLQKVRVKRVFTDSNFKEDNLVKEQITDLIEKEILHIINQNLIQKI